MIIPTQTRTSVIPPTENAPFHRNLLVLFIASILEGGCSSWTTFRPLTIPRKFSFPGDVCLGGRVATRGRSPLDFRARLPPNEIKMQRIQVSHLTIPCTGARPSRLSKEIPGHGACTWPSSCEDKYNRRAETATASVHVERT